MFRFGIVVVLVVVGLIGCTKDPKAVHKYVIHTYDGHVPFDLANSCADKTAVAFERGMLKSDSFGVQNVGKVYFTNGSGSEDFVKVRLVVKTFFGEGMPHNTRLAYIESSCDQVTGEVSYSFKRLSMRDRDYYTDVPEWVRDDEYDFTPQYTPEYAAMIAPDKL